MQINGTDIFDKIYPVGSIYINATNSTNPGTLLGFGTWTAFGAGRVPVGIDSSDTDFDTAEETGGSKTHTLTTTELPSHTHTHTVQTGRSFSSSAGSAPVVQGSDNTVLSSSAVTTSSTGGGSAHNNVQPYICLLYTSPSPRD